MFRTLIVVILTSFSGTAFAQSSLGITGAELSFGSLQDEFGTNRTEVAASVDVAVTSVHGFQGDIGLSDTSSGAIGSLGAHLYMAPRSGQKYGVFATLSDVDGRAMTWGSLGVEGVMNWNSDTLVEFRAGLGVSDNSGLDFIFAGASVTRALNPNFDLQATLDLAEFDELGFRAISYDAGLALRYRPQGVPWGLYANITNSGLKGQDGAASRTRFGLGVSLSLGATGSTNSSTHKFRTHDPVAPLLRRGLF